MKAMKILGWVLVGLLGVAALAVLLGVGVMLLWNALMPDIFGLPEISYLQAIGLLVLTHLLLGAHHGLHAQHKRKGENHRHLFAHKVREKVSDEPAPQPAAD